MLPQTSIIAWSETAQIAQKLDRVLATLQRFSSLLVDVSADVSPFKRDIDEDRALAAEAMIAFSFDIR